MKITNYAHRGASEYLPENTMLAFYAGIQMGATGIETDVQKSKDGVLVLFHDHTLERMTGQPGVVEDYTFAELQQFSVCKNGFSDRIVSLEDFLEHFGHFDLRFAIELKGEGVEEGTAKLLRQYHMEKKAVVTSFHWDYLCRFHQYAPEIPMGYLVRECTEGLVSQLKQLGVEEICPEARMLTKELVASYRQQGFSVRAWGVKTEELMRHACDCGVDGMTVNFPDRLASWLSIYRCEEEQSKNYSYEQVVDIISRLCAEDGCPWDRVQTHESLVPCLMDEAEEVVQAVAHKDLDNLCEELGDVMLQVLMHSEIGRKNGTFDMQQVINGICCKMIRRHPHIFGEEKADSSEESLVLWQQVKAKEKADRLLRKQNPRPWV